MYSFFDSNEGDGEQIKNKILELAEFLMDKKIIVPDNFEGLEKLNFADIALEIRQQLHDMYPETRIKRYMPSVHYANGFIDEELKQGAFILDDIEQYLSKNGFMDHDASVDYFNETITTDGFEINPQSLVMTMINSLLVCVHGN